MQSPRGEKRLLQIGGLAGILSGTLALLFLLSFFLLPPAGLGFVTEENLRLQAQNITSVGVAVSLEFVGALVLIPLFLALYGSLREGSLAYALLGSVLGVLGVTMSAVASTQELSGALIAQLYVKAATADQKAIFNIAQAASASGGGFFLTSSLLIGTGLVFIGGALLGGATFRKAYGWLGVISGVGLIVGVFLVLGFGSPLGFLLGLLESIVWPILMGLRLYRASRVAQK